MLFMYELVLALHNRFYDVSKTEGSSCFCLPLLLIPVGLMLFFVYELFVALYYHTVNYVTLWIPFHVI